MFTMKDFQCLKSFNELRQCIVSFPLLTVSLIIIGRNILIVLRKILSVANIFSTYKTINSKNTSTLSVPRPLSTLAQRICEKENIDETKLSEQSHFNRWLKF